MNRLLQAIEEIAAEYGLCLNKNKCVVIDMNGRSRVKFKDGTELVHESQSIYLGAKLDHKCNMKNIRKIKNVDISLDRRKKTCVHKLNGKACSRTLLGLHILFAAFRNQIC